MHTTSSKSLTVLRMQKDWLVASLLMLIFTLSCPMSAHQHAFALWTSQVRFWWQFRSRRNTGELTFAPLLMTSYTPALHCVSTFAL